jgi:hypothetical protein
MTKKDYLKIGNILTLARDTSVVNNERLPFGHYENLVAMFSGMLKRDNPKFDEQKFYDFCGVEKI